MQACRLSIAEAHPSQVVKAVLDPPSRSAALLLADSSCLLLSSLVHNSPPPPFLIAPSCTDLAFLRLRSRHPASSSSSSSSSSCSSRTPSSLSEPLNEPIGSRITPVSSHDTKCGGSSTIGISGPRSGDDSLFFLAAMPGKGGSCTDLMAWSCKVPAFVSSPIRFDCREPRDPLPASDLTVARLDVPHGVSVKIAASVNVLVVYSPSVNKVWIMSAKLSGALGTKSDVSAGDGIPLSSESVEKKQESEGTAVFEGASNIVSSSCNYNCVREGGKELSTDRPGCLLLIKCAVVDCDGPVFALHLSLQHLLLGQLGGLRVWSLWPLIKGMKSQRKKALKADRTDARNGSWIPRSSVARERTEGCDCRYAEKRTSARCGGSTSIERPAACVRRSCLRERSAKASGFSLAQPRNGFYDGFINGIGNWKSGVSGAHTDVGKDQAGGSAAFMKQQEEIYSNVGNADAGKDQGGCSAAFIKEQEKTDSSSKFLQGCLEDKFLESNGWESKKQEAHAPKMGNDTSDLQHADLSVSKVADQEATPEEVTIPQGRNGILSCDACDLEDWNSQLIVSQSSMFSSSSSSSHFYVSYPCSTSAPAPNVFCDSASAHSSSSSHSLTSTSSVCCAIAKTSLLSTTETLCGLHSTNLAKGAKEGDFLSFQGAKSQENASQLLSRLATFKQGVSIHGLSVGEFVILDSHGGLHLLTLQNAVPGEISGEQRGFRVSENTSLLPLFCSMRIKLVVALPVSLQTAASNAYPASRILWISDGGHTIHIVTLQAREVSEEGMKTSLDKGRHLNVIQTIFTTERISFLYALSGNTVMVLTEGSILAYSMVGT